MRRSLGLVLCAALTGSSWPAAATQLAAEVRASAPAQAAPALSPTLPGSPLAPSAGAPAAFPLAAPPSAGESEARATAAAATAGAAAELERAQTLLAPAPGAPQGGAQDDPAQARERSEQVWSGAAPQPGGASSPSEIPDDAPQRRSLLRRFTGRAAAAGAAGAATLVPAAAGAATTAGELTSRVAHLWQQVLPYAAVAAGIGAAYYLSRLARYVVSVIAKRWGWDQNRTVLTRLFATAGTWTVTGLLGLQLAGVSAQAVFATLGVGTLFVSTFARDVVRNLFEALKVLTLRPFNGNDTIIIGEDKLSPQAFGLRYIDFKLADGSPRTATYASLGGRVITVLRGYKPQGEDRAPLPRAADVRSSLRAVAAQTRAEFRRATLWLISAAGLIATLPYLAGLAKTSPWLAWLLPWAKGLGMLFAVRQADRWAVALIDRIAERSGWEARTAVLVKLGVQAAVYALGITIGLQVYGVNWPYLIAWLGGTSIVIAIALGDVAGNLLEAFFLLYFQKIRVGEIVTVSGVTGRVVDVTWWYVVVEHKDGSHTLLPYSVIGGGFIDKPDPAKADLSRPKSKAEKEAAAEAEKQQQAAKAAEAVGGPGAVSELLVGLKLVFAKEVRLGDEVVIGALRGTLVDVSLRHVELELGDKTRTLVPYKTIAASGISRAPSPTTK